MAMYGPYNGYQYGNYGSSMQMPMAQQPQQASSGINWVQGEQAARSYLVAAGTSVLLMDSDATRFYLKSADNSGMPQPLRIFEYKEIQPGEMPRQTLMDTEQYVTRREFDELRALVTNDPSKEAKRDA